MEKQASKLNAVIVDDDPFCIFHLQDLISKCARDINIVASCENGEDGLAQISKYTPDLVFLDVEMPGMNGFEMLRKLPAKKFEIIFTTSHDHYAIRAIRFAALDYLMKPIDATSLQEAISRLKEKRETSEISTSQLEIINHHKEKKLDNLAVPTMEGLLFIGLNDIIRCEAEDKYTKIFLADKKMILSSRTLGDFESLLDVYGFFRIHKSYLINLKHLKKYLRGEGGQVVMTDGSTLDVSRRKKDELLEKVSQF